MKRRTRKTKEDGPPPETLAPVPETVKPVDEKKKRGRKPKSVYSVTDAAQLNQTSLSDDENVIVRLQVNDDSDTCSEEHPYPYNNDKYDANQYDTLSEQLPVESIPQTLKVVDLLKDFEEKNKNNEWPLNTSICCYWCCHKFNNAPFGVPVSYINGVFEVFGCFCSLECAAAYNFKYNDCLDEIWERYNLINLLCRKLNIGRTVKPAPDKMALKMFGGYMDIETFRKYSNSQKVININFPPMTSLTQQIEEINEYELNTDLRYIPLDNDRINKVKEKMIFKREKPVINEKTTLESTMNLKYGD